ncbi:diphosphate--fructose-6-phosphate 1-phosphotransferase [Bacillus daqingensis]|uniref:Diphosphate--fructose-6-phosphate 1-phosphotransferase n=1 Tax=Bacillus daqingensis TaxID=872396 RepID=A0ABV9NU38_9BACI
MRVAVGQAGGPTSVINQSLSAFISEFSPGDLYLIVNGYEGLADDHMIQMGEEEQKHIQMRKQEPGALLGSGRFSFTHEQIKRALSHLIRRKIDVLVFIGGNGTMSALHSLQQQAEAQGYPLNVIGIPKTVDNDIAGIDHAPGFASAAKYVAQSTHFSELDLKAMRNFEQVRILETMGRNVGWLASAAGYLSTESQGPDYIYVPEHEYSIDLIMKDVARAYRAKGYCLIVISEGVSLNNNQTSLSNSRGRTILGGVSKQIEGAVKEKLQLTARAELLGMNQRCYRPAVSKVDEAEAVLVGHRAAELVKGNESGFMIGLQRRDTIGYKAEVTQVPLHIVYDGGERFLPDYYINERQHYNKWLQGIIDIPEPAVSKHSGRSMIL